MVVFLACTLAVACSQPQPATPIFDTQTDQSAAEVATLADGATGRQTDAATAEGLDAEPTPADVSPELDAAQDSTAASAPDADVAAAADADAPQPADAVEDATIVTDALAVNDLAGDGALPETADAIDGETSAAEISAADSLDAAADATAANSLFVTVTGSMAAAATLHVFALPLASLAAPEGPDPAAAVILVSAAGTSLPWTGSLSVPKGQWVVGALLATGAFNASQPLGLAIGCAAGQATVVTSTGTSVDPPSLLLILAAPAVAPPIAQACGKGGAAADNSLLFETFSATPPTTQLGGAHLLDGVWLAGAYWVAGHQDAWIRFEVPQGETPKGLAGWQPQGTGLCSRAFRVGDRLWCSSRRPTVASVLLDLTTGKAKSFNTVTLAPDALADGMMPLGNRVLVAAHGAGLVSFSANPSFATLPLTVQATLSDPWDVAAVDGEVVAVADGAAGVKLLKIGPALALTQVAHLPLPGLSAMLAVAGKQVLVSSPTGWLHVIDASDPSAPVIQVSMQTPFALWGMAALPQIGSGFGLVAASSAVLAFDLPKPGLAAQSAVVRELERTWQYVLDVDAVGLASVTQVVSAEFGAIRLFAMSPQAPIGPAIAAPKAVFTKPVLVGENLLTLLPIHNLGSVAAQITHIKWMEDDKSGQTKQPLIGLGLPLTIAAGGVANLALKLPKTLKGIVQHSLSIHWAQNGAQPGAQSEMAVQVVEVTHLHAGDALPKLTFQDAQLKPVDVNAALAGKPAVLVVAAHACPMALASLAAINAMLGPLMTQGKLLMVAIDPWDKPTQLPELAVVKAKFPVLVSPLTTADSHAYSALLQDTLAQPANNSAPMPLVYVLSPQGVIVDARLGWEPGAVLAALAGLGVKF